MDLKALGKHTRLRTSRRVVHRLYTETGATGHAERLAGELDEISDPTTSGD